MIHFYFLIVVTTTLTAQQKQRIDAALDTLGDMTNDMPHLRIAVRDRLDGQAAIVELAVPNQTTKADVVNALANALGISATTINNNSTFTIFGNVNDTKSSRDACEAYLNANRSLWENPV